VLGGGEVGEERETEKETEKRRKNERERDGIAATQTHTCLGGSWGWK